MFMINHTHIAYCSYQHSSLSRKAMSEEQPQRSPLTQTYKCERSAPQGNRGHHSGDNMKESPPKKGWTGLEKGLILLFLAVTGVCIGLVVVYFQEVNSTDENGGEWDAWTTCVCHTEER